LPAIAQPVSVCHQWSITGTPSFSCAQTMVSGSARSPARNSERKRRDVVLADEFAGRVFLLDRAERVGAVNSDATLCSSITRQKVPASGVPTGLPSNTIVVAP
jgi:hypothetical protein